MQISFNWMTRIKSSLLWSDKGVTELQPSTIITTDPSEISVFKFQDIFNHHSLRHKQESRCKQQNVYALKFH